MNPRTAHVARLCFAVQNRNVVAEALGVGRKWVDEIMARPDVREYLAVLESGKRMHPRRLMICWRDPFRCLRVCWMTPMRRLLRN